MGPEAKDAVQNTFISACVKLGDQKDNSAFGSWIGERYVANKTNKKFDGYTPSCDYIIPPKNAITRLVTQ